MENRLFVKREVVKQLILSTVERLLFFLNMWLTLEVKDKEVGVSFKKG